MNTTESAIPALLDESPALLDETQTTKFLGGVSAKHLFNLRKRGELPFVRIGTRVMYSRQSLERWIATREQVVTTS